ncbi:hypothetical protein HK100_007079 [Physocladia obscura]|uniref:Uncharacterized protein n=1 Tax=Physocladia obscura TaxID=109957 RepID=A0AAD5XBC4_9FUNG|nr:hypothetical protein HK100_007079 [Physocladia obscura]
MAPPTTTQKATTTATAVKRPSIASTASTTSANGKSASAGAGAGAAAARSAAVGAARAGSNGSGNGSGNGGGGSGRPAVSVTATATASKTAKPKTALAVGVSATAAKRASSTATPTPTPTPTPTTASTLLGIGIGIGGEAGADVEGAAREAFANVLASVRRLPEATTSALASTSLDLHARIAAANAAVSSNLSSLNTAYSAAYTSVLAEAHSHGASLRAFLFGVPRPRLPDQHGNLPRREWDELPWARLLWYFSDSPHTIETLRAVCKDLRLVCEDVNLRAAYFNLMGDKFLVVNNVYRAFPLALTPDILSCLLEYGAIIPKFLIERMYEDANYWKSVKYELNADEDEYDDDDDTASTVVLMSDLDHDDQVSATNTATNNSGKRHHVRHLPFGSLEFCLEYGKAAFKDALLIDVDLSNSEEADDDKSASSSYLNHLAWTVDFESNKTVIHDDPYLFSRALAGNQNRALARNRPNFAVLKKVVFGNYYTPALNPPTSSLEWNALWESLVSLMSFNADMAWHILDHCGCTRDKANDGMVSCVLRKLNTMTTTEFSQWTGVNTFAEWLELGRFKVTEGAVLLVLASPDTVVLKELYDTASSNSNNEQEGEDQETKGEDILSVLRANVDKHLLAEYVETALSILFRNGKRDALRTADVLLTEFGITEEACACAFLAKSRDDYFADHSYTDTKNSNNSDSIKLLPFMTALGQEQGGMIDMMWQLMLSKYGSRHAFVAACVVDTVIGGTLKNPLTTRAGGRFNTMFNQPLLPTDSTLESDVIVVVGDDGVIKYKKSWTRARDELRARRQMIRKRKEILAEAVATKEKQQQQQQQGINGYMDKETVAALQVAGQKTRTILEGLGDRVLTAALQEKSSLFADHDDRDRDTAARDSLEALFEGAKVPIDPGMVGPISRGVLALKAARPRVLDFMARVEQNLLFVVFNPSAKPEDHEKWSDVRWISHIRRNILQSHSFLEKLLTPVELAAYEEHARQRKDLQTRASLGVFSNPSFGKVLAQNGTVDAAAAAAATSNRRSVVVAPSKPVQENTSGLFSMNSLTTVGRFVTRQVKAAATVAAGYAEESESAPANNRKSLIAANASRTQKIAAATNPTASLAILANALKYASAVTSDIVDPEWMEVRRFYVACEDLVALLEGGVAPPNGAAVGPFGKWLKEVDEKNVGVDFRGKETKRRTWRFW